MDFQKSVEHQLFAIPFTVLTLCGAWCPENWSHENKRIYSVYTCFIMILGIIFFTEMMINIVLTFNSDNFNMENIFTAIVVGVGIYKKINVLLYRANIMNFINEYATNQWYKPRNIEETAIYSANLSERRRVTIVYAGLILAAVLLRSILPILEAGTFLILPLEAWYPYNVDNVVSFLLTYLHQMISGVTLSCMHLSTDTLFVSLLMQMCCQINILKHRLPKVDESGTDNDRMNEQMSNARFLIEQRVREHESIYRFGCDLQDTFRPLLAGQMVIFVPNLIINIYFLSTNSNRQNLKYFTTLFYASVSLMQIYMFCWYGNEVTLGSIDLGNALYESNWINLNHRTKKLLLTIITRTSKSILISAAVIVPLNIDSFIKIMKTSYSAFNFLQHVST
uniref:Odorant receptor n=1 Tax=Chouioia cunea TaxID=1570515 RepID=A0A6B9CJU1_9HYME|nr:odorant receptor 53 [Chouioia cunea]